MEPVPPEHVDVSTPRVSDESRPKEWHQSHATENCSCDPCQIYARLCHIMVRPSRIHVMNETHAMRSSDVYSSSISRFYDIHDLVNNLDE